MFSHKDVLPSGRILVFMITLGKTFFYLSVSTFIIASVVQMPSFLCDEIQDYIKTLYAVQPDDRIFQVTKSYLFREMERGCKETGVKRIKVHGLRHSHISLLIDMGFSALAIADRVGHESIDITYRYAHLFPTRQVEMANKLDMERKEDEACH